MTVIKRYSLRCDECSRTIVTGASYAAKARQVSTREGWSWSRDANGEMHDYCPEHVEWGDSRAPPHTQSLGDPDEEDQPIGVVVDKVQTGDRRECTNCGQPIVFVKRRIDGWGGVWIHEHSWVRECDIDLYAEPKVGVAGAPPEEVDDGE